MDKYQPTIDIQLVHIYKEWMFRQMHQSVVTISSNLLTRYMYCYQCVYLINIPQPVQYRKYTLEFCFDLRCESVICTFVITGYVSFRSTHCCVYRIYDQ